MFTSVKERFRVWVRSLTAFLYSRVFRRSLNADLENLQRIEPLIQENQRLQQQLRSLTNAVCISRNEKFAQPVLNSRTDWIHDEIFILGSGSSLLELTSDERAFLNENPTLAMNKYMLFWDILGIWPTYTFLADTHHPAAEVLTRSIEEIAKHPHKRPPQFLLTADYADWPIKILNPLFFKRYHHHGNNQWANHPSELMYFHRGSLSCLLNLVTVLKIAKKVSLMGIDLNTKESFFEERYSADKSLHDYFEPKREKSSVHVTAAEVLGIPPIQVKLPWIFEKMKESGIEVLSTNPKSLLVKDGLCPLRKPLNSV